METQVAVRPKVVQAVKDAVLLALESPNVRVAYLNRILHEVEERCGASTSKEEIIAALNVFFESFWGSPGYRLTFEHLGGNATGNPFGLHLAIERVGP